MSLNGPVLLLLRRCSRSQPLLFGVWGAVLGSASEAPTAVMARGRTPTHSSASIDEGRFPAGAILSDRYRILGLLGQGGMGEVYRAHDQILNQAVAPKFLAGAQFTEAALTRFREADHGEGSENTD